MKKQKTSILNERVSITELNRDFAMDLMRYDYLTDSDVLNQGLYYRLSQAIRLIPRSTKLVAFRFDKKTALGFLCLEENTDWLYTIKYLFVEPNCRKMGIATRLLNHALILAKEKGARKVNLNVYPSRTGAIDLYRKIGFREIGHTLIGQGYLSQFAPFRLIKRAIVGQGCLTKLALDKERRLFELHSNSIENKGLLFNVYKRCMDQNWIDFFEINANNVINGSRHTWQPPFFRDALINDIGDSFALVFNTPFSSKATVELYSASEPSITSILEDLLKILTNRGISFAQITLFNPSDKTLNWFEEKGMKTFMFVDMGKEL